MKDEIYFAKGYVLSSRGEIDIPELFDCAYTFKTWSYLLRRANWKQGFVSYQGQDVAVLRGQTVIGRRRLSEILKISEQRIRTILTNLAKYGFITHRTTRRFSIITICDYERIQSGKSYNNQQINPPNSEKSTTIERIIQNKEINNKERRKKGDQKPIAFSSLFLEEQHLVIAVVKHLNKVTGKAFKYSTPKTIELILARAAEGASEIDFKRVIDVKAAQWLGTEFESNLRPLTLFSERLFEGYLNEKPKTKTFEEEIWS